MLSVIELGDDVVEIVDDAVGVPGPPGPQGADGKSAYQLAVEHGYQGSEQQWLSTLSMPVPVAVRGIPSGTAREGQIAVSDNGHLYIYQDSDKPTNQTYGNND